MTVDSRERVTGLSLRLNELTGEIPPELGNLTNLRELNLQSNNLSGKIPPELGNLANLVKLNLRSNALSGEIPPELSNLINLTELDVANTQLSGFIPLEWFIRLGERLKFNGTQMMLSPDKNRDALTALYNSTNGASWNNDEKWLSNAPLGEWHGVTVDAKGDVTELHLADNQLNGEIPPELGNLTSLESLNLPFNELSGEIPSGVGSLTNLKSLNLSRNGLTGEIPTELGNLTNLN